MKKILVLALLAIAISCQKGDQTVDKVTEVENTDATALQRGLSVPSDYLAAHQAVIEAMKSFDATLTPEKIRSYNHDIDRVMTDMSVFVDQQLSQQSAPVNAGARVAAAVSPDPSPLVNYYVIITNGRLDAISQQVELESISDSQAKLATQNALSSMYNQIQAIPAVLMPEADRNPLLGSHYSASSLSGTAESILQKFAPAGGSNARVAGGFWKKLRKALVTFAKTLITKVVQSFAKGCYQGVSSSGSVSSCIPSGTARASSDLNSNTQEAIQKASDTIK